MKRFSTYIFVDEPKIEIKLDIYQDGFIKIKKITRYTQGGTPYYINEVPEEAKNEVADKILKKYSDLLSSKYFELPVYSPEF
jgi:hypothetical protein